MIIRIIRIAFCVKYKAKIYAQVLVDLIIEKKSKDAIGRFIKLLGKNGDMKKAKEIISLAEGLYFQKTGKRKIILEIARKTKNSADLFAKKNDVVEEKINPELIAGIKVIINGEKQLDFSLQKRLQEIL